MTGGTCLPTTVQVSEKTLKMLNKIKKEMKASSHDQVIKSLILERKNIPCSMFGSDHNLKPFTQEDKAESHEL
jgi:hypothetical protein